MYIVLTVREIMERDIWIRVCNLRDINKWAVSEGQMEVDDTVSFTEEEAVTLGIVRTRPIYEKPEPPA